MAFNVEISPDDEKLLNDILDKGISDLKVSNSFKREDILTNRLTNDNKNSTCSNNISTINTNLLVNNIKSNKTKSSALRALLDEIKSDNSSPSSTKTPTKRQFESHKISLLDNSDNSLNDFKSKPVIENNREHSTVSNKSKEMNFKDMKSEISHIQEKIDGLEKKLFSNSNSLTNLNQNKPASIKKNFERKDLTDKNISSSSLERKNLINYKSSSENIYHITKNILKIKDVKPVNRVNNHNQLSPNIEDKIIRKPATYKELYNKEEMKDHKTKHKLKRNRTLDQLNSNYQSFSTQNSKDSSLSKYSNRKNNNNQNNSNSYYKSALTEWKDRFFKLQKVNDELRSTLINEKNKVSELTKRSKINDKKINNFDDVNIRLSKMITEHENLINQYEQSELIRREQTKLIKSLQHEVDILRKYANISETSVENTVNREVDSTSNENEITKKKLKKKKKKSIDSITKTMSFPTSLNKNKI